MEDETIVLETGSGTFFSMQASAQAIWALIDGTRDEAAIVEILAREYDAPRETVAADTRAFLARCQEAGLIER
jgi:hypothetical protein